MSPLFIMSKQSWAKVVAIVDVKLCMQPQDNAASRTWASGMEISVGRVWFSSRLSPENRSSHQSYQSVPGPELELYMLTEDIRSVPPTTRLPSHSHACSPDDVSDTHEWPIDAKNVMHRMSHWEHGGGARRTALTRRPNPAQSTHHYGFSL